jgi:hypothetical protein
MRTFSRSSWGTATAFTIATHLQEARVLLACFVLFFFFSFLLTLLLPNYVALWPVFTFLQGLAVTYHAL